MLSTTYQRPNTVGFGNFSEDGGRGDREGRGGFQGRSFRGQDNNEVRKPRGTTKQCLIVNLLAYFYKWC